MLRSNEQTDPREVRGRAVEAVLFWAASRAALLSIYAAGRASGAIEFVENPLILWDSGWYLEIAREGYSYAPGVAEQQNIAFFPLWPALLATFAALGIAPAVAGAALASLLFLGALLLLARDSPAWLDRRAWRFFLALMTFFPTSLYFSLPYTESLYLLLSVAVFSLWLRGRWVGAAAVALLAGLTRSNGWLPGAAIVLTALPAARRGESTPVRAAAVAAAGVLGVAAYLIYCWAAFGDFLAPIRVQAFWLNEPFRYFPSYLHRLSVLAREGPGAGIGIVFDGTWGLLVLAGGAAAFWKARLPRDLRLYAFLGALFPVIFLGGPGLRSTVRYSSVLFPIWLFAAQFTADRRILRWALLGVWLLLWLAFTVRFYQGAWVQ